MWSKLVSRRYNFSRSSRLCKKKFQFVYKTGRAFVDYAGVFYVFHNNENKNTRIGVAAGKKLGNAVVRNKIKRLMREIYRHLQYEVCFGFDVVWIARKPLVYADPACYKNNFLKLAKKAGILKKED